jgi:chaperonin GroEL
LLIVADDVEGSALQGLVLNRLKADLKVVAIKTPGYGPSRDAFLKDIEALTGAKLASSSTGLALNKVTTKELGRCSKVVVDAKTTTLVGDPAAKARVDEHVATLQTQLQDVSLSVDELQLLRLRIARLASGVAVIKVGGATELEMIERKYRIEDALNATKAAAEEGIVPGGGTALINAAFSVDFTDNDTVVQQGMSIVKKACEAPLRKILANSGSRIDVIVNGMGDATDRNQDPNYGYDAAKECYCNMLAAGIIDPVKVTRTALENAASVAVTFLSLDAVVYEEPQK